MDHSVIDKETVILYSQWHFREFADPLPLSEASGVLQEEPVTVRVSSKSGEWLSGGVHASQALSQSVESSQATFSRAVLN